MQAIRDVLTYAERLETASTLVLLWNDVGEGDDLSDLKMALSDAVGVLADPLQQPKPSQDRFNALQQPNLLIPGVAGYVNLPSECIEWVKQFSRMVDLDEIECARLLVQSSQQIPDQNLSNNASVLGAAASDLYFESRFVQLFHLYSLCLESFRGSSAKHRALQSFISDLKDSGITQNLALGIKSMATSSFAESLRPLQEKEMRLLCKMLLLVDQHNSPNDSSDTKAVFDNLVAVSKTVQNWSSLSVPPGLGQASAVLLFVLFRKVSQHSENTSKSLEAFVEGTTTAAQLNIVEQFEDVVKIITLSALDLESHITVISSSVKALLPIVDIWRSQLMQHMSLAEQQFKDIVSQSALQMLSRVCAKILQNCISFRSENDRERVVSVFPHLWSLIGKICDRNQKLQEFFWNDDSLCKYLQMTSMYLDVHSPKLNLLTKLLISLCNCKSADADSETAFYVYNFIGASRNLQWNFLFESLYRIADDCSVISSHNRFGKTYPVRSSAAMQKSDLIAMTFVLELVQELGQHSYTRNALLDDQFGILDLLLRLLHCDLLNLQESSTSSPIHSSFTSIKHLGIRFFVSIVNAFASFLQNEPQYCCQYWKQAENALLQLLGSATDSKRFEEDVELSIREMFYIDKRNGFEDNALCSAYVFLISVVLENMERDANGPVQSVLIHTQLVLGIFLGPDNRLECGATFMNQLFNFSLSVLSYLGRRDHLSSAALIVQETASQFMYSNLQFANKVLCYIERLARESVENYTVFLETPQSQQRQLDHSLNLSFTLLWKLCEFEPNARSIVTIDSHLSIREFLQRQNAFWTAVCDIFSVSQNFLTLFLILKFLNDITDPMHLFRILSDHNRFTQFSISLAKIILMETFPEPSLDSTIADFGLLQQTEISLLSIAFLRKQIKPKVYFSFALLGIRLDAFGNPFDIDEDSLLNKLLERSRRRHFSSKHPKMAALALELIGDAFKHCIVGPVILESISRRLPSLCVDHIILHQQNVGIAVLLDNLACFLEFLEDQRYSKDKPSLSIIMQRLGVVPQSLSTESKSFLLMEIAENVLESGRIDWNSDLDGILPIGKSFKANGYWDLKQISEFALKTHDHDNVQKIVTLFTIENGKLDTFNTFKESIKGLSRIVSVYARNVSSLYVQSEDSMLFCKSRLMQLIETFCSILIEFSKSKSIAVPLSDAIKHLSEALANFPLKDFIVPKSLPRAMATAPSAAVRCHLYQSFVVLSLSSPSKNVLKESSLSIIARNCFDDVSEGSFSEQTAAFIFIGYCVSRVDTFEQILSMRGFNAIISTSISRHNRYLSEYIASGSPSEILLLYKAFLSVLHKMSRSELGIAFLMHCNATELLSQSFWRLDVIKGSMSDDIPQQKKRFLELALPVLALLKSLVKAKYSPSQVQKCQSSIVKAFEKESYQFALEIIESRNTSVESVKAVGALLSILNELLHGIPSVVAAVKASPVLRWVPALTWEFSNLFRSGGSPLDVKDIIFTLVDILRSVNSHDGMFESLMHQQTLGMALLDICTFVVTKEIPLMVQHSNSSLPVTFRLAQGILQLISLDPSKFIGSRRLEALNGLQSIREHFSSMESPLQWIGIETDGFKNDLTVLLKIYQHTSTIGSFSALIPSSDQ